MSSRLDSARILKCSPSSNSSKISLNFFYASLAQHHHFFIGEINLSLILSQHPFSSHFAPSSLFHIPFNLPVSFVCFISFWSLNSWVLRGSCSPNLSRFSTPHLYTPPVTPVLIHWVVIIQLFVVMAEDSPPTALPVPRKPSKKFTIDLPCKNDVSTSSDATILSSSPTKEKKRRRGDRSPILRASPSPTMRRNRQKGTPSASPISFDNYEELVDSDQELDIDVMSNCDSDLLSLPQEVLMRILDSMGPNELSRSSSTCRYIRSLSQASWRSLAKSKHPQVRYSHLSLLFLLQPVVGTTNVAILFCGLKDTQDSLLPPIVLKHCSKCSEVPSQWKKPCLNWVRVKNYVELPTWDWPQCQGLGTSEQCNCTRE